MATGKQLQINNNLSHVVCWNMWRNQTSGSVFFSCRSSSWSLTRIYPAAQWLPGSHPAKFKTCLVSARCICIKPHPSCIDFALPPQSPSSVPVVLHSCWRGRDFWSSLVELKAINWVVHTNGKNFWHRHPQRSLTDSRIAMQLLQGLPFWIPFLFISRYSPNSNFSCAVRF